MNRYSLHCLNFLIINLQITQSANIIKYKKSNHLLKYCILPPEVQDCIVKNQLHKIYTDLKFVFESRRARAAQKLKNDIHLLRCNPNIISTPQAAEYLFYLSLIIDDALVLATPDCNPSKYTNIYIYLIKYYQEYEIHIKNKKYKNLIQIRIKELKYLYDIDIYESAVNYANSNCLSAALTLLNNLQKSKYPKMHEVAQLLAIKLLDLQNYKN